jgi:hypothetical protein
MYRRMRIRASSIFWYSIAGLLWPGLLIIGAYISPGPSNSSSSLLQAATEQIASASPPVEQNGTLHVVAGPGGIATAQVFWEQPTRARGKISIELPAKGQGAASKR